MPANQSSAPSTILLALVLLKVPNKTNRHFLSLSLVITLSAVLNTTHFTIMVVTFGSSFLVPNDSMLTSTPLPTIIIILKFSAAFSLWPHLTNSHFLYQIKSLKCTKHGACQIKIAHGPPWSPPTMLIIKRIRASFVQPWTDTTLLLTMTPP